MKRDENGKVIYNRTKQDKSPIKGDFRRPFEKTLVV